MKAPQRCGALAAFNGGSMQLFTRSGELQDVGRKCCGPKGIKALQQHDQVAIRPLNDVPGLAIVVTLFKLSIPDDLACRVGFEERPIAAVGQITAR